MFVLNYNKAITASIIIVCTHVIVVGEWSFSAPLLSTTLVSLELDKETKFIAIFLEAEKKEVRWLGEKERLFKLYASAE